MYNEPRHIVTVFKDYLIFDDFSEYLKRFYVKNEACDRLPRVFDFYTAYSRISPNFIGLSKSELKIMLKNIERKQKKSDEMNGHNTSNQINLGKVSGYVFNT